MKVISVQSIAGGTGVTLTAAELALKAMSEGKSVLAVDTSPHRLLRRDIEHVGFHYLDDVRQLFRPLSEARWGLPVIPKCGILYYPERESIFAPGSQEDGERIGVRAVAGREPDALYNLGFAIAWFAKHYDVMIVDVLNKDRELMQIFYYVSHVVHVMLRDSPPGLGSVNDWRVYIDRFEEDWSSPTIFTHSDRKDVPGDVDDRGRSVALFPFIEAARRSV